MSNGFEVPDAMVEGWASAKVQILYLEFTNMHKHFYKLKGEK